MTIYVVRPGDSLWGIANRFGVSAESINSVNRLEQLPYLVVGQALVIPTTEMAYRVKPGDSLWLIARQFNVSMDSIIQLNNIENPDLIHPDMVLRIPQFSKLYGSLEVNGYIETSVSSTEREIINEVGRFLTYISPFSYQIKEDGTLTSLNDETIIETAKGHRIAALMVITNFRGGNFDSELIHTILVNTSLQETLINNIITVMKNKGYSGLNLDLERIPPADRQLYNDFLRRVVAALHPLNFVVSTALPPKPEDYTTGEWHGAQDYKAHGEIVDFVLLMTYEWGWSGGPPFAVAPINLVRDVVEYAVSVIPRNKITMGIPLYGYDWILPYMPGGPWARRISPQDAVILAARQGVPIQYDTISQSPFFNYTDPQGVAHEVWFEDARSVQAKYLLVNEFGLRGVGYWVLGQSFPQNWYVLYDMFNIVKVI